MIFPTTIKGVACKCRVEQLNPFKFCLLDKHGSPIPSLKELVDNTVEQQMIEEYQLERMDEYYNPY